MRRGWILKSEPAEYSIRDLVQQVIGRWDGVRNYQARNFLKEMTVGEKLYFYHSTCSHPGIYGSMTVHKAGYPDPTAVDSKSKYYDANASEAKNPWVSIDVKIDQIYSEPLLLPDIKALPLGECRLTAKGNRLSVIPITAEQFNVIEEEIKKTNSVTSHPPDITRNETEELPVKRKSTEEKKPKKEPATNARKKRTKRNLTETEGADKSEELNNHDDDEDENDEEYQEAKRKKRKVKNPKDK
jgi:predicted RNA-binding protein with PUA-like domain